MKQLFPRTLVFVLLAGSFCLLSASSGPCDVEPVPECTNDTDCYDGKVCEGNICVNPPAPLCERMGGLCQMVNNECEAGYDSAYVTLGCPLTQFQHCCLPQDTNCQQFGYCEHWETPCQEGYVGISPYECTSEPGGYGRSSQCCVPAE